MDGAAVFGIIVAVIFAVAFVWWICNKMTQKSVPDPEPILKLKLAPLLMVVDFPRRDRHPIVANCAGNIVGPTKDHPPLIAPRLVKEEFDSKSSQVDWITLLTERKSQDFVLDDESGSCIVHCGDCTDQEGTMSARGEKLDVVVRAKHWIKNRNEPLPDRLKAFLEAHNVTINDERTVRFSEGILCARSSITSLGLVHASHTIIESPKVTSNTQSRSARSRRGFNLRSNLSDEYGLLGEDDNIKEQGLKESAENAPDTHESDASRPVQVEADVEPQADSVSENAPKSKPKPNLRVEILHQSHINEDTDVNTNGGDHHEDGDGILPVPVAVEASTTDAIDLEISDDDGSGIIGHMTYSDDGSMVLCETLFLIESEQMGLEGRTEYMPLDEDDGFLMDTHPNGDGMNVV